MYDIGLLGGGQLGRMLIQKGADYGLRFKALDAHPRCPSSSLADAFVVGSPQNYETVRAFAQDCRSVVLEMEHVHAGALQSLEAAGKPIYPNATALEIIQDKYRQKCFFRDNNIPTAPFVPVAADAGYPLSSWPWGDKAVLKLCRAGYDGKGVYLLRKHEQPPPPFAQSSCLLEEHISIAKELALIAGRDERGYVSFFPMVEMFFRKEAHVLDYLLSPASVPKKIVDEAQSIAKRLMVAWSLRGLLALEFFLTENGKLLVNEVSPRVHNSGHHTIEAHTTSQYDQLIRIVCGYPLGDTAPRCASCMVNVLGAEDAEGPAVYEGVARILAMKDTYLHLYGKANSTPLRKMGHITLLERKDASFAARIQYLKEHFFVRTNAVSSKA